LEIFGEFFWRIFLVGIFSDKCFRRNFLGEIFWEDFFGEDFFGEEFFGRNSLFTLLKSGKLFEYVRIDLFVKIFVFVSRQKKEDKI
jgi:hypothetical protein